jgi:hypothetical protein
MNPSLTPPPPIEPPSSRPPSSPSSRSAESSSSRSESSPESRASAVSPPAWAEAVLRACLHSRDSDTVSGDLLEAYRDSIYPERGRIRADRWYIRQVLGIVARSTRVWGVLFAASFVARTALDWWAPPADFYTRSTVSTALGAAILLLAGFTATIRSGKLGAGAIVGVATTMIAAMVSVAGVATLFVFVHDDDTRLAIRGSGGLAESLTLPLMLILPGLILGTLGGVLGAAVRRIRSAS